MLTYAAYVLHLTLVSPRRRLSQWCIASVLEGKLAVLTDSQLTAVLLPDQVPSDIPGAIARPSPIGYSLRVACGAQMESGV